MIGYLVKFGHRVPKIGIKYCNSESLIFTKFTHLGPNTDCDIYKVEFIPNGSEQVMFLGSGYKTKEYTVLELV